MRNLNPFSLRLPVLAAALVLLSGACREPRGSRPDLREGAQAATLAFTAADGSRATVTRAITLDGKELLHGETMLAAGREPACCVIEDVTLDRDGHLEHAAITVSAGCDRAASPRVILDRARAEVTSSAGAWSPPTDAPWIYAPLDALPTPVSAWVTHRAAAGAPALRSVEPASGRAPLVPADQVAIETELGTTVVVGNEGVDVDAVFVHEVRAGRRGITLSRSPGGVDPRAACPASADPRG